MEANGRPDISIKRRFVNLRTLISFVLALAFLFFLLQRLDVNLATTWERVRGSVPWLYGLALLAYYLSFPLRAWRWHLLLRNAGLGKGLASPLGLTPLILLNWFANCVLYARLGDAYRAYLLKEDNGASLPQTMGTVAAERAIDVASVFFLLLLAALWLWGSMVGIVRGVLLAGLGLLVVTGLLFLLLWRFGTPLRRHIPSSLRTVYSLFREGALNSFRHIPLLAGLSLAIWLLEVARLFLVAQALGLSPGIPFIVFASLASALITAIPLTPGGLGLAESGMAGLLMIALPRPDAWSVALVDRSISYLSLIPVGLAIFAWRQAKASRLLPAAHPGKGVPAMERAELKSRWQHEAQK